nr:hypothetical protein [uncultured Undibacterium sp.]
MKIKFAMFLFALGLGTSAAYANTKSQLTICKTSCEAQYQQCIASGTPKMACSAARVSCVTDCMAW